MKVWIILMMMMVMMVSSTFASNCTESCYGGTFCCEDTCCENRTESCCPDKKHGSICCVAENTYCCAPVGEYASHCCPRWNICCNGGRDGCCDPATKKPAESNYGYALFVLQKYFGALKIDLSSGDYTQVQVTGFNDYNEITRVFTYNPDKNLFYLLQADFLDQPSNPDHAIKLYTVDPTTGQATSVTVSGCTEYGQVDVPGFAYIASTGDLLLSTYYFENNMTGYKFYTVDPTSGVATLQSQYINDTDTYVGWFSATSDDGKTLYRIGFQDVVNQLVSGLGTTDISGPTATTQWAADIPVPAGHQFYTSLSLFNDSFASLSADSSSQDLHIVQWQNGGTAKVVGKFSNAHNTPDFGPIVSYSSPSLSLFSSLFVQNNVVSDLDRWSIGLMDFPGGTPREVSLSPDLLAKLESASAFGIPN